jgi:hypothetical protein
LDTHNSNPVPLLDISNGMTSLNNGTGEFMAECYWRDYPFIPWNRLISMQIASTNSTSCDLQKYFTPSRFWYWEVT